MEEPIIRGYPQELDEPRHNMSFSIREGEGNDADPEHNASILFSDVDLKGEVAHTKPTLYERITADKAVLKAVHLGLGFCFLFIGFDACQDLVTTFHEDDGSVGLALLYFVYGVSSFITPIIVEKIGIRVSLFIASLGYVLFIVCVEPYLDSVFYAVSAVEGLAAALLWTSQSVYLSKCAPDASVLGKFSGIFFSIFQTSGILGNLLSGVMFSFLSVSEENALYAFASFAFCGSLTLLMLRPPKSSGNDKVEMDSFDTHSPDKSFKEKSLESPPTSPVIETPMLGEKEPPIKQKKEKKSSLALLIQTLKLAVTTKMLWLHPIFIHQGVSNAIFFGAFPLQMDEKHIGFVIATFAVTDVLGSIFWGKIYDWKGWKVCIIFAAVLGPVAYFTSTFNSIGYWPLYLGAIGFGLVDACQNTVVFGTISSVFVEETEMMCAFAVSKFFNAVASGLIFVSIPYLSYYTIAIIAAVNIVFACGCIAGSYMLTTFPVIALPSFRRST